MITNSFRALDKFKSDHIYFLSSQVIIDGELSEAYISGTNVIAYDSSGTRVMAGLQLTAMALKYLPEGAYTLEDFKFYDFESPALPNRSIVRRPNGEYFTLDNKTDRMSEGGFNSYIGKKITK